MAASGGNWQAISLPHRRSQSSSKSADAIGAQLAKLPHKEIVAAREEVKIL